jgi:hypothetical protein
MEIHCSRCHQAIPQDSLYCPFCGLPQLVYSGEESIAPSQPNQWDAVLHEAGAVEWKPALRAALLLAVPIGLIFGGTSFLGLLGLVWIAAAAAWTVSLYVRGLRAAKRPVLLTTGAGARIGLVTGLIAGWISFASSGAMFYVTRFLFHQGKEYDDIWQDQVARFTEQMQAASATGQASQDVVAMFRGMASWMLTPEGRAGSAVGGLLIAEFVLVIFAVAGGALGAKLMTRQRRQQQL